jgi:hypothetical protein
MRSTRRQLGDERDTSFEVTNERLDNQRPGFQPAPKEREAELEGEHHFPRVAAEKDVPRLPLAQRRIAGKK